MKAVILAGGLGTRISEETHLRPKPMVEIGGKPILWHIMKIYSAHGINEFIICLGYKGYVIKEYFANYFLHMSDVTFDLAQNEMAVHNHHCEPWKVTLVDTGERTQTGGRLKRIRRYLEEDSFCFTYGDGVSNINIADQIAFYRQQGALALITAVQPPGRFGGLNLYQNRVIQFQEKPDAEGGWINGGFFVLSRKVIDYIQGDETYWEHEPIQQLTREGQLCAYQHRGFWHPM
ncbi:MAG TPA: glucose-1-phosphate cytidylyltransferase, partial [Syntrophobacteraceae bacterium]|nr:glucose-1-phosphate cytidylyltransferase [Syntrophobacteraceae bacterium]